MLRSTFIHVPGVGAGTEQRIWSEGVITWDDYLRMHNSLRIGSRYKPLILKYMQLSIDSFMKRDHHFFSANLPKGEYWRAYPDFKTCFLDIETTGLDKRRNRITTIGLYDGSVPKVFVRGKDLELFRDEIRKYQLIVTYNGQCFDLPFLRSVFGIEFDQIHIDLRFLLARLGYTGGLKRIEKELGISREEGIEDVDGFEAVRLWRRYERGDELALQKLVEYNTADIVNLKPLMEFAYSEAKRRVFLHADKAYKPLSRSSS